MFMKTIAFLSAMLFAAFNATAQDGFVGGGPRLAWWSVGSGKELVVMLHGGPGAGHRYLRPEWDTLASVARVIYYDQRGCGQSEGADCYSWQEHMSDLNRLIDTLAPGRKVVLAASSWGTHLALLYALYHPGRVKGIVLSGTFPWMGKERMVSGCPLPRRADGTPYYDRDSFYYASITGYNKLKAPQVMTDSIRKMIVTDKMIELHTLNRVAPMVSLVTAPAPTRLNAITIPVLIFEGKKNCRLDGNLRPPPDAAWQLANVLPRSQVFAITASCHDPWLTHSNLFFPACIRFIQSL